MDCVITTLHLSCRCSPATKSCFYYQHTIQHLSFITMVHTIIDLIPPSKQHILKRIPKLSPCNKFTGIIHVHVGQAFLLMLPDKSFAKTRLCKLHTTMVAKVSFAASLYTCIHRYQFTDINQSAWALNKDMENPWLLYPKIQALAYPCRDDTCLGNKINSLSSFHCCG